MFGIGENHEFLKSIGIDDAKNRDELVVELEDLAQQKLIIKISERLSKQQLEEFNSINGEYNAYLWLQRNVPDLSDLIVQSLREIRDDLILNKMKVVG